MEGERTSSQGEERNAPSASVAAAAKTDHGLIRERAVPPPLDPDLAADRRLLDEKCRLKFALDRFLALLGLPLLAVVAALAFVLMKIEALQDPRSDGPLLYTEERLTQGRPFLIYKFRTTQVGSHQPGEAGRVTRAGHLLKKWYLDELPQLLNVLCGDMTLVGPRPNVPWKAWREISEEGMRSKLVLRAGLTGLVQVYKLEARDRDVYADLEQQYLSDLMARTPLQVVLCDLSLLLRTVPMMLRGEGL